LRAGVVNTPEELDGYRWCGHSVLMGRSELKGQVTAEVLSRSAARLTLRAGTTAPLSGTASAWDTVTRWSDSVCAEEAGPLMANSGMHECSGGGISWSRSFVAPKRAYPGQG
jgi:hypothetical protein